MTKSLAETLKANLVDWKAKLGADGADIEPAEQPDTAMGIHISVDTPGQFETDGVPVNGTLHMLPLGVVRINPKQPRQYLPAEFRRTAAAGEQSAFAALAELIDSAEAQDLEAMGYLDSIATLAASIDGVGLQQPIRVTTDISNPDTPTYQIVDGERRYWAMMYRYFRIDVEQTITGPIAAIISNTNNSVDDIQRAQWAANLYHEAISVVDYADAVWRIREDFLVRLDSERDRYLAQLGSAAEGLSISEAAIQLTINEMTRLTGRIAQRRNLYRYLAIAEKLSPAAKALARAYNLGLRTLMTLSRWQESRQVEAITAMIQSGDPDDETGAASGARAKAGHGGRPSSLRRGINGCITLNNVLQQLSEQNLARQTPDDIRALLAELERVATAVNQARRLLHEQIPNES